MRTLREKQTEVAANAAKYMKAATELAKQEFQCSTDPLKDARTPPKRSKTKRETNKQILSRAQVRALLDYFRNKRLATKRVAFQKSFHRTELSLSLAAMTGMRIGEIAALRLENIDLKTCSLDVIHAFKGEDGIGKPKTEAGVRSIPFDQTLADRISEYCEMWKVNSGLLLARDSGKAIDRHNIQRSIKAAVEELGLPPTGMHGLRHYYVSCLIAAGVDAKTIIYRTGHKDYAFTVRLYGHLMIEQDEKPFVVVV
jgi:integrase